MSSVERLFLDLVTLKKILLDAKEPSLLASTDDIARKTLLIAAASFFEERVRTLILDYYREKSGADEKAIFFVEKKGLDRQFHALFDWEKSNANKFFAFFGDTHLSQMKAAVGQDKDLEDSIHAFMEIGRERNRLVHGNYSQYALEKTPEEVFELYKKAMHFVDSLPQHLRHQGVQ